MSGGSLEKLLSSGGFVINLFWRMHSARACGSGPWPFAAVMSAAVCCCAVLPALPMPLLGGEIKMFQAVEAAVTMRMTERRSSSSSEGPRVLV